MARTDKEIEDEIFLAASQTYQQEERLREKYDVMWEEDEIFLAALQMFEQEERLREKYDLMGEDDFALESLLADVHVPSYGAQHKRKQMLAKTVLRRDQHNLLPQ